MHANGDYKLREKGEIPTTPKEFHLEMPLYEKISIKYKIPQKKIYELLTFYGTIDAYCIYCGKDSVFRRSKALVPVVSFALAASRDSGTHCEISYTCVHNEDHEYTSYFRIGNDVIMKIGQDPSTADLQLPQIQKYRKLLGDEKHREFVRAVGLAAHGVGIGSFVYLRRIFESLIEKAHANASQEPGLDDSKYSDSRIEERILLLKDFLPPFLVKNRAIYEILSKGIHELDEQECLTFFEPLKAGIELILDEKMRERARIEKEKKASAYISKIAGQVRKQ